MRIKDGVLISINKSKDIKKGKFIIPQEVTSIGSYAFYACSLLTSITISNGVMSIGEFAFYNCNSLTKVDYLGTIDDWVQIKFEGTYANPVFYAKKLYINNELITNAVIENATEINSCAFENCTSLTSVTIPNSVTSINYEAFAGCSSLTSVTIPDSITSIGDYAFIYCTSLTSIVMPNSLTSVGLFAFEYCRSLTSVAIGNNLTKIESSAFAESGLVKEDPQYYYKAFNSDLTCKDFKYEENKWFECEGSPSLCANGFHACKNAFDVFNYYAGELNKDIVMYKVELDGISHEKGEDSKVVAKRIRLVEKVNSYAELLNKE